MPYVFLLGLSLGLTFPVVFPFFVDPLFLHPTIILWGLVSAFAFISLILSRVKKNTKPSWVYRIISFSCGFFISLVVGVAVSHWRLTQVIDQALPQTFHNIDANVIVEIEEVVEKEFASLRFRANIIEILSQHDSEFLYAVENKRIQFSWRLNTSSKTNEIPKVGEKWQFSLRMKSPRGFANPGGFSYRAWLLQQNIIATGYVNGKESKRIGVESAGKSNFQLRSVLDRVFFSESSLEHKALFRALSFGYKDQITQKQWEVLRKTGTSHLMAISGLHVGLFAVFGFMFGRLFCLLFSMRTNLGLGWYSIVPSVYSIAFSCMYAALSGFAIPTQRALLMVLLVNAAVVFRRKIPTFSLLGMVWCVMVIHQPLSLLTPGLWLSFLAVASLFWLFLQKNNKDSDLGLKSSLLNAACLSIKLQCVLWCSLLFVLIGVNAPMSMVSPVANIIAVPVVSLVVIPSVFVGMLLGGSLTIAGSSVLAFSDMMMDFLWRFLTLLANHFSLIWHLDISLWGVFIGCVGMFIFFAPIVFHLRFMGLALVLIAWFWKPAQSEFPSLTFLDVGQGLSVVAQDEKEVFVYDVGAKFSPSFDIGAQVLAPFLRYKGKNDVDLVVLSHGDNDHSGGFAGLNNDVFVNSLAANHSVSTAGKVPSLHSCVNVDKWHIAGFDLRVLWPKQTHQELDSNNRSCVVLVSRGDYKILLTGDIEKSVEYALLDTLESIGPIDVLLAPHHGSNTSSTYAFISVVNPTHVVISHGYKNRYRHPSKKVLERYRALDVTLWSTARDGAIQFLFKESSGNNKTNENNEVEIVAERVHAPKPWYQSP